MGRNTFRVQDVYVEEAGFHGAAAFTRPSGVPRYFARGFVAQVRSLLNDIALLRPALRLGYEGHTSLLLRCKAKYGLPYVARSVARAKYGRGDWHSFEPSPQLIAPIVTVFDGPTPPFMDTTERLLRLCA